MSHRLGEHEREIISLLFLIEIGSAEIDAGAALQGREESGGYADAEPGRYPIQFLAGYEAAAVFHRRIRSRFGDKVLT